MEPRISTKACVYEIPANLDGTVVKKVKKITMKDIFEPKERPQIKHKIN